MNLTDSLESIKGIGEKMKDLLNKAGLFVVDDFLHDYPRDYISVPALSKIAETSLNTLAIVKGTVCQKPYVISRGKTRFFSFQIGDGTGILKVTYFGMPYLMKHFPVGREVILYGKLCQVKGVLTLGQPKILTEESYLAMKDSITPVYSLPAGLTNQKMLMVRDQCIKASGKIEEYLPAKFRKKYKLMGLSDAIMEIHKPSSEEMLKEAQVRLAFDEFLLFLIKMEMLKAGDDSKEIITDAILEIDEQSKRLESLLPFMLTKGQKEALDRIKEDMMSGHLMNRLVQGDVGCGKTAVAILSMVHAVENGYQAAIMAPTEVLAMQHYQDLMQLSEKMQGVFSVRLLSGSMKASEKRDVKKEIADGKVDIVVGTHALLEDNVLFAKLGLVVTDEQHRFGVKQREKLMNKGKCVHTLVMSATPIPRTLGLILYGDLAVSSIKELPSGRLPIKNAVMTDDDRPKAYRFMEKQITEGRQCYVICPMVEASETDDLENVYDYAEKLKACLPNARIGIMHGKLKPSEKDALMASYKSHELDVLVSTTVIEVGVNVPNATCMLIENADRFGLAQLHQLRGRVGRGQYQSYCMFITANSSKKTLERLRVLENTNDGFVVAEEDLKQRGPGDFFGIRQSGGFHFRIADLYRDAHILMEAKECSEEILKEHDFYSKLLPAIAGNPELSLQEFYRICL